VTLTAVLAAIHPNGAIVNLTIDRGDLVPGSYCAVPDLAAGATSVSFALPTAVVSASTDVHMYVDIAYTDAAGVSRQLVSVPSTLTLAPGGTAPPPPPLASFTLTPSTIAPGQSSFMDVVLSKMAPAQGVNISVSSSNPAVASVIPNGQPTVLGGCTTGGGAATVAAANSVPQQTTVTISASSGDPSQTVLTHPLTVTGGCQPKTCLEASTLSCGASCGSLPDGCGGTLLCGCDNCAGGTCGGGGTPNVCGVPPTSGVSALTLSPTSVMGGTSATGTVTLASPAPAGGAGVFLSSSNASASVPPSVVVQGGQTSASFTITTSAVSATTSAVITAQYSGSATATLTITTGATCTSTTCAALGKNCGTISDGCGGTLTCGSCTSPQTCGGGGVANICGSGTASTAQLTRSATGRSGESVSSSPAGLTVNVGTTGSASFATGTLVTLTVSNGRDAVWSGGCSSGGDTQKSCSLTLNAATSVTANVQ